MGRLAGFTYREVTRKLAALGFQYDRTGKGSHEVWRNPQTKRRTTVPNHSGDFGEGLLRAILRQADVRTDQFLDG